jgi:hypothetical protein
LSFSGNARRPLMMRLNGATDRYSAPARKSIGGDHARAVEDHVALVAQIPGDVQRRVRGQSPAEVDRQ